MSEFERIYKMLYEKCFNTCALKDDDKRRRHANKYAVRNTVRYWKGLPCS